MNNLSSDIVSTIKQHLDDMFLSFITHFFISNQVANGLTLKMI